MKKILLMGNPNVGKSALFVRLTGVNVIASNYPGSTVEFTKGYVKIDGVRYEVIDVPGTYTLQPTCIAEEVAVKMIEEGDIIINVVDSTNLERNLNLTFQLIQLRKPMILVCNFWDEIKHKGISIDDKTLSESLDLPVIPTTAVVGEGIVSLIDAIRKVKISSFTFKKEEQWKKMGEVIEKVQKLSHRHHSFVDIITEISIKPITGIPIAFIILFLSFTLIRYIGEGCIAFVTDPFFEILLKPLLMKLSMLLGSNGFFHDIIIGTLVNGELDFLQSFGLLTTGLYVPLSVVLPYIVAFYLILGLLEDIGYLPRLGVLLDRMMHVVGLHGMSFIPMLLGLGCNVSGALACRTLESRKERFVSATLMAVAIPCWAQIAMIIGLIGKYGASGLFIVFGTLLFIWIVLGIILKKSIKGDSPEMFAEMPPYRLPYVSVILKKIRMRLVSFIKEALPFVFLGVVIVNILYSLGVIEFIGNVTAPVIQRLFGLPKETVGALIIGFLRKDVAVGMLANPQLGLSFKQLIVAAVVLTVYFPCVGTFSVLVRELGAIDMLKSAAIMIITALITGTALNLILTFAFSLS
ncbi:MAG: ferrous iron transporter B [Spirochaetales bacterium]|nr:ferrous iron transporter B [Spirochaetales bacterium]